MVCGTSGSSPARARKTTGTLASPQGRWRAPTDHLPRWGFARNLQRCLNGCAGRSEDIPLDDCVAPRGWRSSLPVSHRHDTKPSSVDPEGRAIALNPEEQSAGPKGDVGELFERARGEVADLLERASRELSAAAGRIGSELEELVERAASEVSTAAGRVGSDVEGLADRAHDEVAGAAGRVGSGLGEASKKTRRTTRRTSRRLRRKAKRTATTTREQFEDGLEIARQEGVDALRANQRVLAVVAAVASAAIVALVAKSKKSTGNGRDDVSSL